MLQKGCFSHTTAAYVPWEAYQAMTVTMEWVAGQIMIDSGDMGQADVHAASKPNPSWKQLAKGYLVIAEEVPVSLTSQARTVFTASVNRFARRYRCTLEGLIVIARRVAYSNEQER